MPEESSDVTSPLPLIVRVKKEGSGGVHSAGVSLKSKVTTDPVKRVQLLHVTLTVNDPDGAGPWFGVKMILKVSTVAAAGVTIGNSKRLPRMMTPIARESFRAILHLLLRDRDPAPAAARFRWILDLA
jgi:hypothetical protein